MSGKVSVIVLTYNQENTIGRTLDGILRQEDAPDFEIIIGEDGSQDGTRKVCEEYRALYPDKIRLMPKESNKGLVWNYRDCFLAARGDYIADCSGDDYWVDSFFLGKSCEALRQHTDVSIVYGGLAGGPHSTAGRKEGRVMFERLLNTMGIPEIVLSASVYRKKDVEDLIRTGEILSYSVEDYPIIGRLLSIGDAYSLGREVLEYDSDSTSLSRPEGDMAGARIALDALGMRLNLIQKYGIEQEKLKEYIDGTLDFVAAMLLRHPKSELLQRFDREVKHWQLTKPKKARFYRALMGLSASWRMAAYLRNSLLRYR